MNDILVAQVLVDPYGGKTPPFEVMFPNEEPDVGQVQPLTDEECAELGLSLADNKCPVFIYYHKDDINSGAMASMRFETKEEVIEYFKDLPHTSIGGRRHTVKGVYIIRFWDHPEGFDKNYSDAVLDLQTSLVRLDNILNKDSNGGFQYRRTLTKDVLDLIRKYGDT